MKEEDERREHQNILEDQKNRIDANKAFMDRSVMIKDAIDQEVAALQVEDPKAVIKKALEDRIRFGPTDVPGFLGQVPLTKAMIDRIASQKVSPVDVEIATKPETKASPVQDSTLQQNASQHDSVITLTANPEHVDYGGTITLDWEHQAEPTVSDWIGFYVEGAQSKEYVTYEWVLTKRGSMTFKAPTVSGNYVFRYFVNKSYVSWGTSNIVKVGPAFRLTPTVVDTTEVKIKVEQLSGHPCPNAWVAMYEPDKDHKTYYTYLYLGTNTELTFKIPKVGIWEFRLFPQKAYYVAESTRVNLNGNDQIALSIVDDKAVIDYKVLTLDPNYDNVWVGIFNQSETDNRQWRRYKYIPSSQGQIFVKAMQTPGTYEARLFARNVPSIICRSNSVTIPLSLSLPSF